MATTANTSPVKGPELIGEANSSSPTFWSMKRVVLGAVVLVAVATGLSWWLYARQFETTGDAQVDGHFAQLSARATGTLLYVNPLVENDRFVTAGTELVRLDPRDYQ